MSPRRGRAVPAATVRRVRLDHGLVVIVRRNPAAPSVALRLAFEAGSAFDPPDRPGTAALVARLVDRGAGGLPAAEIARGFEHLGASVLAITRRDSLDLEGRMLAEHLPAILPRLRLLAERPDFPQEEIDREKDKTLTAIAERDQDTAEVAEEALAAALFPAGHPYHAPALGTRDSVAALTRDDLVAWHGRRFGPAGAVLAIAGDVDPDRVLDLVGSHFGDWAAGGPGERRTVIPDAPAPAAPIVRVRPIPGKTQADIVLGVPPGIRRLAPDLPAVLVLNRALGEFGLGGRLGAAVRERGGLAYYAFSYFAAGLGRGPLVARAGVAPANVARAVALMRRTVEAVRRRGPTDAEIRDARQSLAASVPRRLETNRGAASYLAECEFHGLGVDYPERIPGLVRAVTRRDVEQAAHQYLGLDRHALVVAGPEIKEEDLR